MISCGVYYSLKWIVIETGRRLGRICGLVYELRMFVVDQCPLFFSNFLNIS